MADGTEITVGARPRSVTMDMAERFGMEPAAFEQTLRATVVPANCTREQFAAFLLVARVHNLNPITKEIFAFPANGGIQPIVSVDGWAKLMNSHPQFDGLVFEDHLDGAGKITAITAKVFRKDRTHPVEVTEYMAECVRQTPTWKQWPARMLRHKATIQAARLAFGFAGIMEPDEFERMGDAQNVTPMAPPQLPSKSSYQAKKDGDWDWFMKALELVKGEDEADALALSDRFIEMPRNWREEAQTEIEKHMERLALQNAGEVSADPQKAPVAETSARRKKPAPATEAAPE